MEFHSAAVFVRLHDNPGTADKILTKFDVGKFHQLLLTI
jgi:hypothetical protein